MRIRQPQSVYARVGHLVHFTNDVRDDIVNSFEIRNIKYKIQKIKGPLKLDNPITSILDSYKMEVIAF